MEAKIASDRYPLAAYDGEQPPSPTWFRKAVETPYTSHCISVDGADIWYQQWGIPDNPGLLLVHGNGAHSHWYDFIAPAFADEFNVVAIDLSGMGDSDWRDEYSLEQFSSEQIAVMQDSGMFDHAIKPIIAAHSFGGIISLTTTTLISDRLGGLLLMDSTVFPPEEAHEHPRPQPSSKEAFFPDLQSALNRFRLLPPQIQKNQNHNILDHIARYSLKQVERNGVKGWGWKFDPALWGKLDWDNAKPWAALQNMPCKFGCVRGARSSLFTDDVLDSMSSQVRGPFLTIEDAGHHLFLDKPQECIAAVREILALWNANSD